MSLGRRRKPLPLLPNSHGAHIIMESSVMRNKLNTIFTKPRGRRVESERDCQPLDPYSLPKSVPAEDTANAPRKEEEGKDPSDERAMLGGSG